MDKEYIKMTQEHFSFYSVSLSVHELINNTFVDYYNSETGAGYQRPLVPAHYRKIAKYLQMSPHPILPTAILAAVDPEQIIEGRSLRVEGKLRIVDGQHRIEGIKYLQKLDEDSFERICRFDFPVQIMVISPRQKIHEINAFININKTSKPVSTDLAVQLRDKIRGDNLELILSNLIESIATKVAQNLNKSKSSIWFQLIKVGDEKTQGRTISINAFHQSLFEITENYLLYKSEPIESIDDYYDVVEDISYLINRAWEIITKRWNDCFYNSPSQAKYNIQKGIGVYSLHGILSDVIKEAKGSTDDALRLFAKTLLESQVKSSDWKIGGKFSPFNSRSGFQKITDYIKNNIRELDQ